MKKARYLFALPSYSTSNTDDIHDQKEGGFYLCTKKKPANSAVGSGWMSSSSVLILLPGWQ